MTWPWLGLLAAALIVTLAALGTYKPLTTHEVLVARTAWEMLYGGDWLSPRFAGELRLKKPPLAYWLVAGSYRLFGVGEWSARLPSAVCGVVVVMAVAWQAARLWGPAAGLATGLVQTFSVHHLTQARLAEADMALALGVAACVLLIVERQRQSDAASEGARWRRRLMPWCFAFASAWATLAKGPVAWLFIAPPLSTACFLRIRHGCTVRGAPPPASTTDVRRAGLGVVDSLNLAAAFLAAVLALAWWPAAIMWRHPQAAAIWRREIVDRMAADLNGVERIPGYYLIAAAWLTLPGSLLLIATAGAACRRGRGSWRSRIADLQSELTSAGVVVGVWATAPVLLLSLSSGKSEHYLVPCLPAWSMLLGWLVTRRPVQSPSPPGGDARPQRRRVACRRRFGRRVAGGVLAASLAVACIETWLLPRLDGRRESAAWAQMVDADVPKGRPVVLVGHSVQWLAFYFDRPVRCVDDASRLETESVSPDSICVTSAAGAASLAGWSADGRRSPAASRHAGAKRPVLLLPAGRFDPPPPAISRSYDQDGRR